MGVGTVNNNGGVGGVLFQTNSENGRVKQNEDYMLINSKPNGKLNALGIKQNANVCKVSSPSNTQTVYIDERSQARKVQNKLTSNIKSTADNFLKQLGLEEQIGKKFKTQLESLRKCYGALESKAKHFTGMLIDDRFALLKAITDINDLVYRLNNKSVGGINKLKEDKFLGSKMCLAADRDDYKKAKTMAKSKNPLERKEGKKFMKKYEEKAFVKRDVLRENLVALDNNLGLLEKFSESKDENRSNVEKMLNLIQQCCLNAWVFNDVAKSLEGIGFNENDLENLGVLSDENKEMRELNNAARNTTMFKEVQINDLIKDGGLTIDGSFNGGKVKKYLERWGSEKIGFRGRHGVDENDKRVSSKPIGNTKKGEEVLQSGSLFKDKEFAKDKYLTAAIEGSVVPDETANLKTVPDAMLEELKGILNTTGGQKIKNLLKEKGLIKDVGGVLQAKPSFASFINDAGLPTYCSVSGTTGEIVSVLHCTLKDRDGNSPLAKVFDNLLKITEGKWPNPPFNFSTYFAPIATFMEVGHFHTTGEVLGGFLSVAVADRNVNSEVGIRLSGGDEEKIKQYDNNYKKLLTNIKMNLFIK